MMETLIEKALGLLVGQAASALQPSLPWLDKLFQLNKIERENAEALAQVTALLEDTERQALSRRNEHIEKWLKLARASESADVRANESVIRHVASSVFGLKEAGVQKVVLYDSNNAMAIISDGLVEENANEILARIVAVATSESVIQVIEAEGYVEKDEVISERDAVLRLAFIFSLTDIFQGKWSGPVHCSPEPELLKTAIAKIEINTSWLTHEEYKQMREDLKKLGDINIEDLTKVIDGSEVDKDFTFLNVFVVGMRGTGKSTTRWLLTGSGRDDIAELAEDTTRQITFKEANTVSRVRVWDTPGLNEGKSVDDTYLQKIKGKLMSVSHISSVILQVGFTHRQGKEEIDMLKQYNTWFGRNLAPNLMIVFRTSPKNKNLSRHIESWETTLDDCGIGRIGKENYICLRANTEEDCDDDIVEFNTTEVQRAMKVVEAKDLCVVEANKLAARAILESEAVQEGERRQKLKRHVESLTQEENAVFERVLLEATELHVSFSGTYGYGQLQLTALVRYAVPRPGWFRRLLWWKSRGRDTVKSSTSFILQGTCKRTRAFLKKMAEQPTPINGDTSMWANKLCGGRFKLLSLTTASVKNRILHVFEKEVVVDMKVIKLVVKLLGTKKAHDILHTIKEKSDKFDAIQAVVDRTKD